MKTIYYFFWNAFWIFLGYALSRIIIDYLQRSTDLWPLFPNFVSGDIGTFFRSWSPVVYIMVTTVTFFLFASIDATMSPFDTTEQDETLTDDIEF